ncbi:sigma-70 family RNA polymerase sigma factor [Arcicella rosea]|uniref:RNA polymerase sigma-70 factor (ECF subfamily) n=1 Tax=Arcicella rosea TaxID=502909 RepID=A0A841EET5_9BACT|nr:sigma-70 family RNA polymerase sigma factor [Arcicella rosea]MBB6001762.1 RNA polymerase sigma-70 factor (ECF subfamily) [Arcicella rosea]
MKLITLFQTEEALVKACQKGDPKAQRRVYEKYSPKMLGICFRYVHDEFEAEEIMIEGFVKVFDKINSFKLEGSFEGWIRRIMVNESLMYLRSNKKTQFEVSYDQILYEPEPEQFKTDLETKDLLKLIEKLPTGYRTVFNLYAIEGFSHAEIANQLGITESTSKSQLSRARVILQNAVVQMI